MREASWVLSISLLLLICPAPLQHAHAQSNSAAIRIEKEVDNQTPSGLHQTVEFTVRVTNYGDAPATDVQIEDRLPPELKLPEVMVPVASRGNYNLATGNWRLGDLGPGESETLVIPAVYSSDVQPDCSVNQASYSGNDLNKLDNWDRAAVRGPGIISCVDLRVGNTRQETENEGCDRTGYINYIVTVVNDGPGNASDVLLKLKQAEKNSIPGLRFKSPNCTDTECHWDTLPARDSVRADARSEVFRLKHSRSPTIEFSVSSNGVEYRSENNLDVESRSLGPFGEDCGTFSLDSGGGSGCFIATAAYGSSMDARIAVLRKFRDHFLLRNFIGRKFVKWYYRYSPPAADYIATRPWLRAAVRGALAPVVFVISYPFWTAGLVLLGIGVCLVLFGFSLRSRSKSRVD